VVEYQDLLKAELDKSDEDYKNRLTEIRNEIMATGTYQQTYEEISYGAKVLLTTPLQGLSIRPGPLARGAQLVPCRAVVQVAWRNSSKCIGRINWKNMIVRDMRHLNSPEQLFVSILEHLEIATNAGKVRTRRCLQHRRTHGPWAASIVFFVLLIRCVRSRHRRSPRP
jgi:nitric oxide synthase oxygenase domain/subunit